MEEFTLSDPVKPKKKFPIKTAAGAAAVVIVLAGAGIWYFRFREITKQDAAGREVATAQPGQVVSGFPDSLIQEKNIKIESSYRISAGGVSQLVVVYISAMNLADNIKAYKDYFTGNNWQIIADGSKLASPYIYAATAKYAEEANVSFAQSGGKVQVTAALINRPAQTPAKSNEPVF